MAPSSQELEPPEISGRFSRDRNFTVGKIKGRRQQLEESVARYLAELDRADRDPALVPEDRVPHLKGKLAKLHTQMEKLDAIEKQLEATPDHQISLTDPDARSMTSSGRGTGTVGYNVQAADQATISSSEGPAFSPAVEGCAFDLCYNALDRRPTTALLE